VEIFPLWAITVLCLRNAFRILVERDYRKFNFSILLVKFAASRSKHTLEEDKPEKKARTT